MKQCKQCSTDLIEDVYKITNEEGSWYFCNKECLYKYYKPM